jgi:hypothetical protein
MAFGARFGFPTGRVTVLRSHSGSRKRPRRAECCIQVSVLRKLAFCNSENSQMRAYSAFITPGVRFWSVDSMCSGEPAISQVLEDDRKEM